MPPAALVAVFAAAWAHGAFPPLPRPLPVQDEPSVGPIDCKQCPWGPRPGAPGLETGLWPIDQLVGLSVDWFGADKTRGWLERGALSLQKNVYRKYYIESGYFLIQLPPAGSADIRNDHMIWIPKDPSQDPRVIFMGDIHRLSEAGAGTHDAIVEALLSGDRDLLRYAGRTIFDSKLTLREWNYSIMEQGFDGTQGPDERGRRPWYYKFRQSGLTKLRVEGGIGESVRIGDLPLFAGGALTVEAGASYRSWGLRKDAVPRAKLGLWGKVPYAPNTSFGLSAIQGWHAEGGVFETEFRAGIFHGVGDRTFGAIGYHRRSGPDPWSREGAASGAQVFYSPSHMVSIFLSYERAAFSGEKDDQRFLVGVDLMAARHAADPAGWAESVLGEPPIREAELEAFHALAGAGLDSLESSRGAQDALDRLRAEGLRNAPDFMLILPGGAYVALPPALLLEGAREIERWEFNHPAPGTDPPVPGWALTEVPPRAASEVIGELIRPLPPEEISRAREIAGPGLERQLAQVLLIHASNVRRSVDFRVAQAATFLGIAAQKARQDPYARTTGRDGRAELIWRRLSRLARPRQDALLETLARAAAWLGQEFRLEGARLEARLKTYGKDRLETAQGLPGWPKGLRISVQDDAWAPILAGHGERFLAALISPFKEKAAGKPLIVSVGYVPLPGSVRLRQTEPGRFYLELPAPGRGREDLLRRALESIRAALE